MADFVSGYLDENRRTAEGLTNLEKEQEYPLFLQWDTRWGYLPYGEDSIIGLSGCGPTCMSMVLYYLTDDDALTPDKLAAYAMSNNYYAEGIGTAWVFMEEVPLLYGIRVSEPRVTERAIKAELDKGAVIICAMAEGDFTVSGHFIVIYGYDEAGFKVNDPNCVARSRKRWCFNEIHDFTTFIDDTLAAELTVLRHSLLFWILCCFRYFSRKWHKIPAGEFVR
jgi:hypothetical protein